MIQFLSCGSEASEIKPYIAFILTGEGEIYCIPSSNLKNAATQLYFPSPPPNIFLHHVMKI